MPLFSPQAAAGRRICAPHATVSFDEHIFRHDEQFKLVERLAHAACIRQRNRRIGRHHPQRLDLAASDRLEHLHRLVTFALRHVRRVPEAADAVDLGWREAHMRGKLVGETADLAAAHRIRLARQRERPHARLADAAGGEMAIDDGVDLVGALRRLIHALRVAGDGTFGAAKQIEELLDVGRGEAGPCRDCIEVRRDAYGSAPAPLRIRRCARRYRRSRAHGYRQDARAGQRTAPSPCRARPAGTDRPPRR